ncbi:MAG: hypothetical protein RR257_06030, partial [Rikenellaceae bacterium]
VGGKTAKVLLQAIDYAGNYYEYTVSVIISKTVSMQASVNAINYTLAEDETSTAAVRENGVNVNLKPMFDELVKYGTSKSTFVLASYAVSEDGKDVTYDGKLTVEPYSSALTTDPAKKLTGPSDAWQSLNILFDVKKALPKNYSIDFSYEDRAAGQMIIVTVPVNVTNPVINWNNEFVRTDLFVGNKLNVYGNTESAQASGKATYDLRKAYSTFPAYCNFSFVAPNPNPGKITDPLDWTGNDSYSTIYIDNVTVNTEYKLDVVYQYFGNDKNTIVVPGQTILVTPKSFVAEGKIDQLPKTKSEVTYDPNNSTAGQMSMKAVWAAWTVNDKTNLDVFGTHNQLVKSVTVVANGKNKILIDVVKSGNDFIIKANNNTAGLTSSVNVDLVITITDQMDQILEKTVIVTVRK